ncbi:transcription elongation regulator [Coemansia sp. BCRC 34301]|nr:transcription elongation regulator [Coemansia sp. BCRC 34301]
MVNDHDWAVFLAPADPQGRSHAPNEPYYFERNNEITTWIRPFDYTDAPLSKGESWQHAEAERKLRQAWARAKADRPSRQATVRGTDWKLVTTVQGREYYYNTKTQVSQWSHPAELDKEEEEEALDVDGTEMNAEDAEWMLAQMDDEEEDDKEMDSEVDDHNAAADVPKDERIAQFKAMLHDIGVNAFSTWEMQVSRFESDPRFGLIDAPAEQRDLFEAVCKETAAAKSKPKEDDSSAQLDLDPFDQLLREKVAKRKTSFAKFCHKNLKDPRFTSVKTSREREKRFIRHLETLQ